MVLVPLGRYFSRVTMIHLHESMFTLKIAVFWDVPICSLVAITKVSEETTTSIFYLKINRILLQIANYLPDYMVSHPRWQ
jgi:hypothetical protein